MSSREKDRRILMSAPEENLDWDSRNWVEKNSSLLLVGISILLVMGGAWAYLSASATAREEAAALAAADATTAEDFLRVAREFSGTQRAAIAYIQAASLQNVSADWEGLRDTSREFLEKYPQHAAAFSMRMSLGTALEALNQKETALSVYEEAAAQHPNSFRAGEALFRAGVIQQDSDNPEEARKLFDAIVEKFPNSIWAGQARQRLAQLPAPPAPPLLKPAEEVSTAPVTPAPPPAVMPTPVRPPEEAPLIPPEP